MDSVAVDSVTDMVLAGEVGGMPLWVVLTPSVGVVALGDSPEGSTAAALVRHSAGPVDFRVEGHLVEEITAASVTGVSVDAIATFAIVAFASLMEGFLISAFLASDIQAITLTITPITTHTFITTTMRIKAPINLWTTEHPDQVKRSRLCNLH